MTAVSAFPAHGEVFFDARDDGRSLRLSHHAQEGLYVVSIWRHDQCVATFQLSQADVPGLIDGLIHDGLSQAGPTA